jgi:hypothetical protein
MSDQDEDQRDDIDDEDEQETDTTGEEQDDEGADDDDPDAGKSPEDLRAELKALRASRAKLLRESKNRAKNGKKDEDGKDTFTKDDVAALREETQAAARAELMPALIRNASRGTLEFLGMVFPKDGTEARAKLTRTLKLAEVDDLEIGEDGEIVGLEHALREVRRTYPELFRGSKVRTPGNAGGGRRAPERPKSATELQAAAVFGASDDDD